jgi:RNA polymerase sigma-70 factor (ECF subfamily)
MEPDYAEQGPSASADLGATAHLLARARDGDERARELLCARFLPILTRWAHRRLPPAGRGIAETDDLVQVTLVRALRRVPTFEARREGAFLSYLRTILMNSVREELRRSRSLARRHEHAKIPREPVPSELERLIGRERLAAYERGLLSLSEEHREAVLLRLEFGLSHKEIAEAQGKPSADAARMTVARAIHTLAELLDGHGP